MIKVMFVCYGNICRSPMAEFFFKELLEQRNLSKEISVVSAATSSEEIGNPVYYATKETLLNHGIQILEEKHSTQLRKEDYEKYDFFLGMEQRNVKDMMKILKEDFDKKVFRLLDFTDRPGDIADPWYTRDFEKTYQDIKEGCEGFLNFLIANNLKKKI